MVKLFKKNDKSYAFHLNIHIVNMSQKIKCSLVFLDTDIFHSIYIYVYIQLVHDIAYNYKIISISIFMYAEDLIRIMWCLESITLIINMVY